MAKRPPAVERDPGKARKRAVGVALVGVMGAALGYEGAQTIGVRFLGQGVEIVPDIAACGRRFPPDLCERAFALARSAHDAHATRLDTQDACLAAWESCETNGGRWRPTLVAVGVARDGRRLIARALARPRAAEPGDYVTTGAGEAYDPDRRTTSSSSSSSSSSGRWGASSSGSSSDGGASTQAGGGEHVSAGGAPHGVAAHGVARGGFGAIGHGFSSHGG